MTPSTLPSEGDRLFVYRPLHNARDLLRWARRERFKGLIRARDLHVTVATACSADIVVTRPDDLLIVPAGGERSLFWFGEGLVVLAFTSPELPLRALLNRGLATKAQGFYRRHVSFAIGGLPHGADPTPYDGALIFGAETVRPAWP